MGKRKEMAQVELETENTVTEETAVTEDVQEGYGEFLFEGGPKVEDIDKWKAKYGKVYLTEIDEDNIFIWRALYRKEYKELVKIALDDPLYREERIAEICTLWPENVNFSEMDEGKAGTPTILSEQIMEKSGFAPRYGAIVL